mmetsp:Transcript_38445/g.92670  ORF Transcript_38445/g.92670 Transcript_38445/m.92670 type:complete len:247 (-) Transcript_38445:146-886(-)
MNPFAKFAVLLTLPYIGVDGFSSTAVAPGSRQSNVAKNSLPDAKLIELAEDYVASKNGFYAPVDRDAHADDFVFRGGVVGPLNKLDYCNTMTKLRIYEAFDLSPNAFGFCVDPDVSNTVRFYVRFTGRQVENWKVTGTPFDIPPSSENVVGPTESFCIQFNEEGKVKFFTISAPMLSGNPQQCTTGKYGAVLGLFVHAGMPTAADSALNKNVRDISNAVAGLLPEDVAPPKSKSNPDQIPSWYEEC